MRSHAWHQCHGNGSYNTCSCLWTPKSQHRHTACSAASLPARAGTSHHLWAQGLGFSRSRPLNPQPLKQCSHHQAEPAHVLQAAAGPRGCQEQHQQHRQTAAHAQKHQAGQGLTAESLGWLLCSLLNVRLSADLQAICLCPVYKFPFVLLWVQTQAH